MIRHSARPRKTVADYMNLPEDVRVELIDGEFFVSPSARLRHQRIVSNLHFALRSFAEQRDLGTVHIAPLDVHLPTGDIVQPDVIFVSTGNEHVMQDWIRGAPDLLIEVVSAANPERDRIVKRDLYARSGVAEYWLVDDATETVEVLVLDNDRYAPHGYFETADTIESKAIAGLRLPVHAVFMVCSPFPIPRRPSPSAHGCRRGRRPDRCCQAGRRYRR